MTELKVRNPRRMNTSHRGFEVRSVQHSLVVGRSSRGGTVGARRGTKDLLINELQLTTQLIALPEGRVVDFILATALVGGGRGGRVELHLELLGFQLQGCRSRRWGGLPR